ncbi:MAG: hypothetical protein IJ874_07015 [Ruminococcus sp.]|nr:hypothetical protein [Ruminococcus sp.]
MRKIISGIVAAGICAALFPAMSVTAAEADSLRLPKEAQDELAEYLSPADFAVTSDTVYCYDNAYEYKVFSSYAFMNNGSIRDSILDGTRYAVPFTGTDTDHGTETYGLAYLIRDEAGAVSYNGGVSDASYVFAEDDTADPVYRIQFDLDAVAETLSGLGDVEEVMLLNDQFRSTDIVYAVSGGQEYIIPYYYGDIWQELDEVFPQNHIHTVGEYLDFLKSHAYDIPKDYSEKVVIGAADYDLHYDIKGVGSVNYSNGSAELTGSTQKGSNAGIYAAAAAVCAAAAFAVSRKKKA